MSLKFLNWSKKINRLCQRHFSIISTHHKRNNLLLKHANVHTPFVICPYNRRDFIGFVPDKKDGYKTQKDLPDKEHIKFGLKQIRNEFKLWTEEMKETLRADPLMICPPGMKA